MVPWPRVDNYLSIYVVNHIAIGVILVQIGHLIGMSWWAGAGGLWILLFSAGAEGLFWLGAG